jgi:site-specific DNA-methyltransferase (adenine-specific)
MINLMQGDCLEKMKEIESGSIDAIICDPPYGTTACKWDSIIPLEPMWEHLNRVIKLNGAIVLFGSEPFSSALRISNIKNYKNDWVWNKSQPSGMSFKMQPMRTHENILIFGAKITFNPIKEIREGFTEGSKKRLANGKITYSKKGNDIYNIKEQEGKTKLNDLRNPTTILKIGSVPNKGKEKVKHPTQKPVALMEYLIKTYTNEGETVLDFTMGSGTTGVACVNLNRKFTGIEQDEKYFKIAEDRINSTQIIIPVLELPESLDW